MGNILRPGRGPSSQRCGELSEFLRQSVDGVTVPIANPNQYLLPVSLNPPLSRWHLCVRAEPKTATFVSVECSSRKNRLGDKQAVSATYVGQSGRNLFRQEALYQPNSNFIGDFLLTQTTLISNYNALQIQYRRPLLARVQALVNYTWSHSLDNASSDVVVGLSNTVISAASDYASLLTSMFGRAFPEPSYSHSCCVQVGADENPNPRLVRRHSGRGSQRTSLQRDRRGQFPGPKRIRAYQTRSCCGTTTVDRKLRQLLGARASTQMHFRSPPPSDKGRKDEMTSRDLA